MSPESFKSLGVAPELVEALAREGIGAPFPIQALTIRDALLGRDVCGKAKTGSGKTLAFGIPTLMQVASAPPGHPSALVLVPTRESPSRSPRFSSPWAPRSVAASSPSTGELTSTDRSNRSTEAPTSSSPPPDD